LIPFGAIRKCEKSQGEGSDVHFSEMSCINLHLLTFPGRWQVADGCGHLQPAAALYREATTHLISSDDDGSPDTIPPKNSRGPFRVLAGILAGVA
jgi:hypothetical protein